MKQRMTSIVAGIVLIAFALTGCTVLPTSGSFQPGNSPDENTSDARWQFNVDGPTEGAGPEEIVLGFLDAGESPQNDWAVAREFLTPDAAAQWNPYDRITIDSVNDRDLDDFVAAENSANMGSVTVRVTPTATLDETGAYHQANDGVRSLDIELTRVEGEWRISAAPDGVIVQSGSFASIFTPYELAFSGPGDFLVPDVRWFPDSPNIARRVVGALVEGGPSDWLSLAVDTAFDGVEVRDVRVDDDRRVVTVALSEAAADASPERIARMQTQLTETLGVEDVRIVVGGTRLTAPEDQISATQPDTRPVVLGETDDGVAFGYLAGGEITPIDGLSDVISEQFSPEGEAEDPATSIAVSPDLRHAVLQTQSEQLWLVSAGDDGALYDALSFESGWVAPSLDPLGHAWSVKSEQPDVIVTWDTETMEPHELRGLEELSHIDALQVSRDGARIAIVGRIDDQPVLVVAGIRRGNNGTPIALSGVQDTVNLPDQAASVAWLSSTLTAALVLGDSRTLIREQTVGGMAERPTASFVATAIAYGNTESRERLLADDGALFVRDGTTWAQAGTGVLVLATQAGAPPVERETQP